MSNNEAKTFDTNNYTWSKHGNDAIMVVGSLDVSRKWRDSNSGNGLIFMNDAKWYPDEHPVASFDDECKLALRALVGPPPWEKSTMNTSRERILELQKQISELSNEAEEACKELVDIALKLSTQAETSAPKTTDEDRVREIANEVFEARLKTVVASLKFKING